MNIRDLALLFLLVIIIVASYVLEGGGSIGSIKKGILGVLRAMKGIVRWINRL